MKISISKLLLLLISSFSIVFSVSAQAQHDPLTVELCDRHIVIQNAVIQWFTDETSIDQDMLNCNDLSTNERLLQVKYLDFSESNLSLSNIPDLGDYERLENVTRVSFANNNIEGIPAAYNAAVLVQLPPFPLKQVDFSNNSFTTLPANICLFSNSVLIGGNNINTINGADFVGCDNLITLDISNNGIASLPANFLDNLGSLQNLNAENNQFSTLPAGFFPADNALTSIKLASDSFTGIAINSNSPRFNFLSDDGTFSLDIPSGMPFDNILSLTGSSGVTINTSDTFSYTISKGETLTSTFQAAYNQPADPAARLPFPFVTVTPTAVPSSSNCTDTAINGTTTTSNCFSGFSFEPFNVYFYTDPSNIVDILPTRPVCTRSDLMQAAILAATNIASCERVGNSALGSITTLAISSSAFSSVKVGDLDGISSLETLDISGNAITSIPEKFFSDAPQSLLTIDLSNNSLTTLPSDTVVGFLTSLNVENNSLISLPDGFFPASGSSLDTVLLGGNPAFKFDIEVTFTDEKLGADNTTTFTLSVASGLPFPQSFALTSSDAMLTLIQDASVVTSLAIGTNNRSPEVVLENMDPTTNPSFMITAAAIPSDSCPTTGNCSSGFVFAPVTAKAFVPPKFDVASLIHTVDLDSQVDITLALANMTAGKAPYSYSITNGQLLTDLVLNPVTAKVSGNVTQSGTVDLSYTVTDALGQPFTIPLTMNGRINTPSFGTIADLNDVVNNSLYNRTLPGVSANTGTAPITYTLTKTDGSALPTGLTLDPNTRVLSGTPTELFTGGLTYTATDANDAVATTTFTLTIVADMIPTFVEANPSIVNITTNVGDPITPMTLPAGMGGNTALTYTLKQTNGSQLPAGLEFNPVTRMLSQSPTTTPAAGVYFLTYSISDIDGDMLIIEFEVNIIGNTTPTFASTSYSFITRYDRQVQFQLENATLGNGAITYALIGTLPSGLSFDDGALTISGTSPITATTQGTYTLNLTATDADGDVGQTQINVIISLYDAPVFDQSEIRIDGYIDNELEVTLPEVSNPNLANPVTYSLITLTAPYSFNPETRKISGLSSAALDARLLYIAEDSEGRRAISTVFISIFEDLQPAFSDTDTIADISTYYTSPTDAGQVMLSDLPTATGGNPEVTYSMTLNNGDPLPADLGLSFDAVARTFSGTVQKAGTYALLYIATDRNGDEATLSFTLTITGDSRPEFSRAQEDLTVKQNKLLSAVLLEAVGGEDVPITYALTLADGTPLPAGINFDPDLRSVTATLSQVTTYALSYTATDIDGDTAELNFDLTVIANTQPSFADGEKIDNILAVEDFPLIGLELPAVGTNGDGDHTYNLTIADGTSLPAGLSFNSTTRIFSGTPSQVGNYTMTYSVTDSDGDAASLSFNVSVAVDTIPAFFGVIGGDSRVVSVLEGFAYNSGTLPLAVGGNYMSAYALIINATPAVSLQDIGMSFNATSRIFSGTPSQVGNHSMIYSATDFDGDYATDINNPSISNSTFIFQVQSNTVPTFNVTAIRNIELILNEEFTIYDLLPVATGGNGDKTYALTGVGGASLPPGVSFSFNPRARELDGTPTQLGTYDVVYTASDSDADTSSTDSVALNFKITVVSDTIPVFAAPSKNITVVAGIEMDSVQFPALTGGNEPYSYRLLVKRGSDVVSLFDLGMNFNVEPTVRTLSGTPSQVGNYTMSYSANDRNGDTLTAEFTLEVEANIAPAFGVNEIISNDTVIANKALTDAILPVATDGNGDLSYNLTANNGSSDVTLASVGLSFDAMTRTFSGTPTVSGTYTMTYTVSDSDGDTASLNFTVTVVADTMPTFGTQQIANISGIVGVTPADVTLPAATDGNDPISYALTANDGSSDVTLASIGLSFDASTRVFSGTPTTAGTYTMTYTVTDGNSDTATLSFTVTVDADTAPDFGGTTVATIVITANELLNQALPAATDGNGDLSYTLSAVNLNGGTVVSLQDIGLSFNATSRALTGSSTNANVDAYNFTYTVTDSNGDTASLTFVLNIRHDRMPEFGSSTIANITNTVNEQLTAVILPVATSGNVVSLNPLRYTLIANNGTSDVTLASIGLSFDDSSRTFSGTPNAVGTYMLTYTVSDNDDDTATLNFTVTVVADTMPTFGTQQIANISGIVGVAPADVTLPAATDGNDPISYALTARDGSSDVTLASLGLSFDASTRVFSGTPTTAGTYTMTYTVTDGNSDTATLSFTVTVDADTMPTFGTQQIANISSIVGVTPADVTLPESTEGNEPISYALTANDGSSDVTLASLGLSFDASTRVFSGTPTMAGTYTMTYTVTDGNSDTATLSFTVTVDADTAPDFGSATIIDITATANEQITAVVLPESTEGNDPISYALTANDGNSDVTLASLGLSFDGSSRTFSGTPNAVGTYMLTYTVSDNDDDTATLNFTLTVLPEAPTFDGATIENINVVANQAFTAVAFPTAIGGNGALSYTLTLDDGSALPTGLSFNATSRVFSGTPTTAGSYMLTYTVSDSDANTTAADMATLSFTLIVEMADVAPAFGSASIANIKVTANEQISVVLPVGTAGNGALSYTLTLADGSAVLPAGLSFDDSTRTFSGTPATAGSYMLTYIVSDSDTNTTVADSASLSFTVTVVADAMPDFGSDTIADISVIANEQIAVVVLPAATDGNGVSSYALTLSDGNALPSELSFDTSTRSFSGTPTAAGALSLTYTASDSDGDTATLSFTVTVVADAMPDFGSDTIADISVIANEQIAVVVLPAATDGNGVSSYTLTLSDGNALPSELSFDTSTRSFSGTPTTAGALSLTYTASDSDGDTATLNFTVTVVADAMPDFGSDTIADISVIANEQIAVVVLPAATDGNGVSSYNLTLANGSALSSELSFDPSTRSFSGTPTTAGVLPLTYTASDSDGDTATLSFTVTVVADAMPDFGSDTIADISVIANEQIAVVVLPAATDGNGVSSYNLTLSDGNALPSELSFDTSTRSFSGTPTAAGALSLTYTASDSDGDTATLSFTVTVVADAMPDFGSDTIADISVIANEQIAVVVLPAATDGNGVSSYTLTLDDGSALPTELSFDTSTRSFSGTPTAAGALSLTYTASDDDGDTATLSFTVTVVADAMPDFGSDTIADISVIANEALTDAILPAATDGNGVSSYTLTLANGSVLPSELSFDTSTRSFNGTPTTADVLPLTYTASDSDGDTATLNFTVTVVADAMPDFGSDTIADISVIANEQIAVVVLPAATDGNGVSSYNLTLANGSALSSELSFDPSTRSFSGTPTTAGVLPLTYTASDSDGDTATLSFTVTVVADAMPDFGSDTIADISVIANEALTDAILPAATDGNGASSYTLTLDDGSALPSELSFDASTRSFSGTPTTAGALSLTYTASDSDGDTATLNFTVTVVADAMPTFGADTIANISVIANEQITAVELPAGTDGNGVSSYTLTLADGSVLPTELSFDASTRSFSGTPTTAGALSLTYTASDSDGDTATLNFTVTVVADAMPTFGADTIADISVIANEQITAVELPAGTDGNGVSSYTLTLADGSVLPTELSFDASTRSFSGTPNAVGTYMLTYTASDSDGDTATLNFTVTVVADAMPTFGADTIADISVIANEQITAVELPAGTDGNGVSSYTLTLADGSVLPTELSFDASTRSFSGTPTTAGALSLTYTASDSDGDTATLNFTVTVVADAMPTFGADTIADISVIANEQITAVELPAGTDGNGVSSYTLTLADGSVLPTELSFDASTRSFSGTPNAVGTYMLTYTASDTDGDTATLNFTVTVVADAMPTFGADTIANISVIANEQITAVELPAGTDGNGVSSYTLTLADGSVLPTELSFDASTRSFSGTPNAVGTYMLTYTASDTDGDTATLNFTVTVVADAMPEFDETSYSFEIVAEEDRQVDLTAAKGGNGVLTYALSSGLPTGMTFDNDSLTISGTATELGSFNVTLTATDEDGDSSTTTVSIEVIEIDPVLLSVVDITDVVGNPISIELPMVFTGTGTGPFSYALTLTEESGLPAGMSFDSDTRILSGSSEEVTDAELNYTVTDSRSRTASTLFSFTTVADTMPAFDATATVENITIAANQLLNITLPEATGGNFEHRYSLTQPNGAELPTGLSFDVETRLLSGSLTVAGEYTLVYSASDSDGDIVNFSFTIEVEANTALEFTNSSMATISLSLGEAIDVTLSNVTTTSETTITYAVTGQPSGVTFNSATRLLSGAPTEIGEFEVTYTASSTDKQEVSQKFTIEVSTNLEITQDVMWRQALYIAGNTVESVKQRFSLVGENRLPYVSIGSYEGANFNVGGDKWIGLWLNTGSGSLDNSVSNNFSWDSSVDVTQVGFDFSGPNFLVGLMQETVSASASFTVDTNGTDYTGSYDIDGLSLLSIYGGYVTDKFSAWLVSSSGSGDATLNINAGNSPIKQLSGVDYSMSAIGASYTLNEFIDLSYESILAASLDLTNASLTPHSSNEGSRTKFAGNFKYNIQRNTPAADLKVIPKVSIAQRSDSGDLHNGSVEESGLETTFGLELKYKRLSFEFGIRNFSAENFSESSNWLTFHLIPNQDKGMNLKLTRQVGSNASNSEQLFENREFDQILANMSNDQSITHLGEISYSWDTSIGNLKLFTITEESTSLGTVQNVLNTYKFGFNFSSDDNKLSLSTELLSADQYADEAIRFTGKLNF